MAVNLHAQLECRIRGVDLSRLGTIRNKTRLATPLVFLVGVFIISILDKTVEITEKLVDGSAHSKDTKLVVAPKDKLGDAMVQKLAVLLDPEMEPLIDLGYPPPLLLSEYPVKIRHVLRTQRHLQPVKVTGIQFPTFCTQPSIVVARAKRHPTKSLVSGGLVTMVQHHPIPAESIALGKDIRVHVLLTIRLLKGMPVFLDVTTVHRSIIFMHL